MTTDVMLAHPLMALFITIGSYIFAQWLQKKLGGHSLLNPVVMAIIIVVVYIIIVKIPYQEYLRNVNLIHSLLGPATVALAIPLYNQLSLIRKSAMPIGVAVLFSCLIAAGVAFGIAFLMGASQDIQLSIIPKSATTAIAVSIAEKIRADTSLAVFFVFTTGIIGSAIAMPIFRLLKITDSKAIGLSLGVTCHGLGVARAFQHSEKAGAFAALGMSLMGIVSGILLPVIVLVLM